MRRKVASALLVCSVVLWGVWFGGQFFNYAMVIPRWHASLPETMRAYGAMQVKDGLPFFLLNPFFFLFALAAAVAAWKYARASRKWLALSTLVSFAVCLVLVVYLAPLIHSLFDHAAAGDMPASEFVERVGVWEFGNKIRLVFELFGFVCSIMALRVWSAEAESPGRAAELN